MYAVILAGGGGTRLWPLSTPERPKPFLPLLGTETLFQRTVRRLLDGPELALELKDIVVVTDRRYARFSRDQAPGICVLEEPEGRNTAAAVALATIAFDRPSDEVMVILPADHAIEHEGRFRGVLAGAEAELARGAFGIESPLVTLGIEVSRPATEYGYLIPDTEHRASRRLTAFPLIRFEEKPNVKRATWLGQQPGVAWNAGMFLCRRRAIHAALADHAPDLLDAVAAAHGSGRMGEVYPRVRSASIDVAVMEPAANRGQVVMGAMNVGWSDLGGWTALLGALGAPGVEGRVVQAGERAVATEADLFVRRRGGRLTVEAGPGTIADEPGPVALLEGGAAYRKVVDALVGRVAAGES